MIRQSPWLAGEHYSLADVAMIPFIDRINYLRHCLFDTNRLPRLIDWYDRMRKRPAFDKAFAFRDDSRAAELPKPVRAPTCHSMLLLLAELDRRHWLCRRRAVLGTEEI
jgi:hypothetical protein